MLKSIDYCSEVASVICEDCPLRELQKGDWQALLSDERDPIAMGQYVTSLRSEVQHQGMPEGNATEQLIELDESAYFEVYPDDLEKELPRAGKQLVECLGRNAAGSCADILPPFDFKDEDQVDLLESIAKTGSDDDVKAYADRMRGHMLDVVVELRGGLRTEEVEQLAAAEDRDLLFSAVDFLRKDR